MVHLLIDSAKGGLSSFIAIGLIMVPVILIGCAAAWVMKVIRGGARAPAERESNR